MGHYKQMDAMPCAHTIFDVSLWIEGLYHVGQLVSLNESWKQRTYANNEPEEHDNGFTSGFSAIYIEASAFCHLPVRFCCDTPHTIEDLAVSILRRNARCNRQGIRSQHKSQHGLPCRILRSNESVVIHDVCARLQTPCLLDV